VVLIARRFALVLCSLAGGLLFWVPVAVAVAPPVVEETGVSNVAGTSATLRARINPEGSETTYRFEYGTSEAYGSAIPVPDGLVGSGSVGVTVSGHPQDLSSGTTYHYRVVALVASRSETVPAGDGTFTTQPAGGEFALPDGRQWEWVTPPNKHGGLVQSLGEEEGPLQASADGSGITYETNTPTELEPQGYENQVQIISTRGATGWSTRDIATPHSSVTRLALEEYRFFSTDLSLSFVYPIGEDETLLSSQASEPTPYIRREDLCDAPATASECYLPLLSGKEGFANVPPGTKFGAITPGAKSVEPSLQFAGASPDLSHVLLKANVALTGTPTAGLGDIYERSGTATGEALQLVSMLPASEGGGPAREAYVGGNPNSNHSDGRNAISDDGSRVFWMSRIGAEGFGLYMRDTVKEETVRLDVQQAGVSSGGSPYAFFQIASSDASKVFFTDFDQEQRLTPQSGTQGRDLYECEILEEAGKLMCKLTDLTPESAGQSAEVRNIVLGASKDGSYVYFVANGILGDGLERGAKQGSCEFGASSAATCNLYEYHDGATTFIAALSAADQTDWGEDQAVIHSVGPMTARVSSSGRYVAFMSERSLTGYDNRDVSSGKPDMEVYLYDAQTKRLVCASCNPTGSQPAGVEVLEFISFGKKPRPNLVAVDRGLDNDAYNDENWIAANLPPGVNLGEGYRGWSQYQPRALSDSGRLFFNSSDALVSQDVNGQEDVYEYEPEGEGGCTASSVTFNSRSGGCVGLVSSGTSPEESGFMDASEGGDDVFFLTTSRLTSQDYDTALDLYDAHVCSVSVPCVALPVSSPPCSSGDSCKAAPSLQPPVFGAPASATFNGAGNLARTPSPPPVKQRFLTRSQKLARALKACAKKPKKKRTACKRLARKRFGARAAGRVSAARKGQG
jgi:hypothetical protein